MATMTLKTAKMSRGFKEQFYLMGSGTVIIDWGDQEIEEYSIPMAEKICCIHSYTDYKNTPITIKITGNVTSLTSMYETIISFDSDKNSEMTSLYFVYGSLESLNVKGINKLISLQCAKNKLKSLDVSGLNELRSVHCDGNEMDTVALDKLFASLNSTSTTKQLYIKDNPGAKTCTVKTAINKGWKVDTVQLPSYPLPTLPATTQLQKIQMELYIKLAYITNPSDELLKKKVQDRKLKASERIFKEELLVAQDYLKDYAESKKNGEPLPEIWHPECRFELFEKWFNLSKIAQLLQLFDKQQATSASLIPIKGISKIMQAKLRNLGIYDTVGLLTKGKMQKQRDKLASDLDVDVKLVNVWVKQADLWRINDMTTDTAYLLVQIGVRHCEDLSKVAPEKAYPIMDRLVLAQPDFQLIDKTAFKELVQKAEDFANYSLDQKKLTDKIKDGIVAISGMKEDEIEEEIRKILNQSKNNISLNIESLEDAPVHLFDDKYNNVLFKSSAKVIEEGLGFLKDIVLALPLPHTITGQIYMKEDDVEEGNNSSNPTKKTFPDALVEISGISSPSEDKTEEEHNPSGYTDSEGNFIIVLPDKYNLQEVITITVSDGLSKQKFIKSASDVINSVPQQAVLDLFDQLQTIKYFIQKNESKIEYLEVLKGIFKDKDPKEINLNEMIEDEEWLATYSVDEIIAMVVAYKDLTKNKATITTEIGKLKGQVGEQKFGEDGKPLDYETTLWAIFDSDNTGTTDLEIVLFNLMSNDKLNADLGEFTLISNVFYGYQTYSKKTLPSVRFMGDEEKGSLHLSTDTAPSRVFNYGMLQRLVEPAVDPPASSEKDRVTLASPVDVMDFKSRMYNDPDNIPKMASLGIGYVLNMHQAWVPDGFALGTLLYSLVLAPGEEQRLIVRENRQSYTVADDMEGRDTADESYNLTQIDDATAAFNSAVDQVSNANSGYKFSANASGSSHTSSTITETEDGGRKPGLLISMVGSLFGMNSSVKSKTSSFDASSSSSSSNSGSGSSFATQSNAHNEASNTAQSFQHSIKSASNKISQSKRISVRTATSAESDSVATKIIANHNHSHAMTIQYWEVMRRYRLETCIDGVDLILFVPLKPIRFLPVGQTYIRDLKSFDKNIFNQRYSVLLQYADTLFYALPYKYRTGLNLIKKYAAYPEWTKENDSSQLTLTSTFKCDLLTCDNIKVALVLKNGKGTIAGRVSYNKDEILAKAQCNTTNNLKQYIYDLRNNDNNHTTTDVKCTFDIPAGIIDDDFSYIKITHSCNSLDYKLYKNEDDKAIYENLTNQINALNSLLSGISSGTSFYYSTKATIDSLRSLIPEAYRTPIVTLSATTLSGLGAPSISDVNIEINGRNLSSMLSSDSLSAPVSISIKSNKPTLLNSELQEMEALMHHVAADTLYYSQVIWASLSDDEMAMMLERYTIDMNFDTITGVKKNTGSDTSLNKNDDIPLLNCVNVKKRAGFYGNCVLMPFTYPQRLAEKLGKTAAELQESLYRYHTNCFRVPKTTISLPTDGMIGEAVLGETNVSELIDLTRFWNWKDSPIDKMNIDSGYLNSNDYLAGKAPGEISALNLQGATSATPVTVQDLITALANKQAPTFENLTALEQLKEIINKGTDSAAAGRDKLIENSTDLMKAILEHAAKMAENDKSDTSGIDDGGIPGGGIPGGGIPGGGIPGGGIPGGGIPGGGISGGGIPGDDGILGILKP